jgi:beta-glucuronidase
MKSNVFLLIAILTAVSGFAQPLNVYNRTTISLDGAWHYLIDPMETGYYDYRFEPKPDGFFLNQKVKNKTELIEYDFSAAPVLQVPGDWNSQNSELLWYEGTIWYEKDFEYRKTDGKRLFLHFGAVNYEAHVYVNGQKVGEHIGGFTPFSFEITGLVNDGNNFIVVKVNNVRRLDGIPTVNSDWWNYGGITRSVSLVETPKTYIQDYSIRLEKGKMQEISGYVQLSDAGERIVTIQIPELQFKQSYKTNKEGVAKISFTKKLDLWSPENPKLYDVEFAVEEDVLTDQIGFRTIETRGQDILLNGKPVFLRGTCVHEENPLRGGRAYSVEDARLLLGWAKEMGCNFVRLAHYTHNENMIREAEKMGIMVWSEIPLYWTIQWQIPSVFDNAKNQFTEMFNRDKNRAAVILWSLANETPLGDARLQFLTNYAKYIRSLDDSRLLTAALEIHTDASDPNTIIINDPLGEQLDVLGCNEYLGWYGDALPAQSSSKTWKTIYDKPLIMSEFGAGALAGKHGTKTDRWTEEFQASFFEENLAMLKKIPFLRGTTPWILVDFRSPKRPLTGIQDYYNRKGLISEKGEKKQAFNTMKAFYNDKN